VTSSGRGLRAKPVKMLQVPSLRQSLIEGWADASRTGGVVGILLSIEWGCNLLQRHVEVIDARLWLKPVVIAPLALMRGYVRIDWQRHQLLWTAHLPAIPLAEHKLL